MGKHKQNFLQSTALPVMLSFALVSCGGDGDAQKDAQQKNAQTQEVVIEINDSVIANDVAAPKNPEAIEITKPISEKTDSGAQYLQETYNTPAPFVPGTETGASDMSDGIKDTQNSTSGSSALSEIRERIENGETSEHLKKQHMFPPPFIPGTPSLDERIDTTDSINSAQDSTLSKAMQNILKRIETDGHKYLEDKHQYPPPFVPKGNEPE